jgi:hypothetical protein
MTHGQKRQELLSRPIVCTGGGCTATNHLHPGDPGWQLTDEDRQALQETKGRSARAGNEVELSQEDLAQFFAEAAAALGGGTQDRRDAQQRAIGACERLREALIARRGFKKYREGLWDELYRALETVHRASAPPTVRQAFADLERRKLESPAAYIGNVKFREVEAGEVIEVAGAKIVAAARGQVVTGCRRAPEVPASRQSLARQLFAANEAARRAEQKRRRK